MYQRTSKQNYLLNEHVETIVTKPTKIKSYVKIQNSEIHNIKSEFTKKFKNHFLQNLRM